MDESQRVFFDRLVAAGQEPDIAQAALWVARIDRPAVDVGGVLERVDALAEAARAEVLAQPDTRRQVAALCRFLREREGFRGNDRDYYAPENSFLDLVLETRTGIPIALGALYMAIGRRLGLDIEGVNFPGHFLLRVMHGRDETFVDPFAGAVVDVAALAERLRRLQGAELGPEHLASASIRAIVLRMLNNLKIVYLRRGDPARALAYCDWIVELAPRSGAELRDRALILEQLGQFEGAANDYERLLDQLSDSSARRKLERRIRNLRARKPKTFH